RCDRLIQRRIGIIAREAQRQLGDGTRASKPLEMCGKRRSGSRHIERTESVELPARLGVQFRGALSKEVERRSEAALRFSCAPSQRRANASVARHQLEDA